MESFENSASLVRKRRITRTLGDFGPHPAKEWRLNRCRLEVASVYQIITKRTGEADRPIPEDRVPDETSGLLRRRQRSELQHRALDVEATPRERVKARVPEELIGILRCVRARIAIRLP